MSIVTGKIKRALRAAAREGEQLAVAFKNIKDSETLKAFCAQYQAWYTSARKLVEALAPDRLDEFVAYYRSPAERTKFNLLNFTIQDFVIGVVPRRAEFDARGHAEILLHNQTEILSSLRSRVDSVLADVRGHLFAELQDSELQAAGALLAVNARAAGALAGVVMERHLQRVAANHNVQIDLHGKHTIP